MRLEDNHILSVLAVLISPKKLLLLHSFVHFFLSCRTIKSECTVPLRNSSCVDDASGSPRCFHALKRVRNNQSNGMAQRNVRGDVETRELKSASGTSNVSFCVFSKRSM